VVEPVTRPVQSHWPTRLASRRLAGRAARRFNPVVE